MIPGIRCFLFEPLTDNKPVRQRRGGAERCRLCGNGPEGARRAAPSNPLCGTKSINVWRVAYSNLSTLLNEKGWHPDVIELQLAHAERNKVRAAYNRAQRLVERRTMMQAWADYLDELTASGGAVASSSAQASLAGTVAAEMPADGDAHRITRRKISGDSGRTPE